jgi:hypothetical protein
MLVCGLRADLSVSQVYLFLLVLNIKGLFISSVFEVVGGDYAESWIIPLVCSLIRVWKG